ncbi:acyl-CoA dehydrogenase family protein [Rhodococcus sp. Eu-32]|uniref:acyl-CoA dehydrogenase family protein n=1 Tax=Rhodococcus sp. Eu-32 TaxID=1017319 RepID=UPI001402B1D7|nr:acyl-CoA dehydrogenase family protein [Rhodococcus sp. Eu-32]
MRHSMNTMPTEIGQMGAEGIRDLVKRATALAPIATYAEQSEPPVSWASIASAGWDLAGVVEDGEGATSRDLVSMAREWGYGCIPQPLLPTLLAKRHSAVARECDGPVTFALALGGQSLIPFGTVDGISFVTTLGDNGGTLMSMPRGEQDGVDLVARGVRTSAEVTTSMTEGVAKEVALVFAAEALGGAERLLADSIEFVKQRTQFGRPVGSFQAVKHKLANAAVAVESAETALIWGSQRSEEAFRSAMFAIDKCIDVAEIATQTHGGLGFTWEVGLHFPFRKFLVAAHVAAGLETVHG